MSEYPKYPVILQQWIRSEETDHLTFVDDPLYSLIYIKPILLPMPPFVGMRFDDGWLGPVKIEDILIRSVDEDPEVVCSVGKITYRQEQIAEIFNNIKMEMEDMNWRLMKHRQPGIDY